MKCSPEKLYNYRVRNNGRDFIGDNTSCLGTLSISVNRFEFYRLTYPADILYNSIANKGIN